MRLALTSADTGLALDQAAWKGKSHDGERSDGEEGLHYEVFLGGFQFEDQRCASLERLKCCD